MKIERMKKFFKKPEIETGMIPRKLTLDDINDLQNLDLSTYSIYPSFEADSIETLEKFSDWTLLIPDNYRIIKLRTGTYIIIDNSDMTEESENFINNILHLKPFTKKEWDFIINNELQEFKNVRERS